MLQSSDSNPSGFKGVSFHKGRPRPYKAKVSRGGEKVSLGAFVTAEEAALCYARDIAANGPPGPIGVHIGSAPAPAPLTAEEALRQAEAEGLTLVRSEGSSTGYRGVSFDSRGRSKPFEANVRRGGKQVSLGAFATARVPRDAFVGVYEGEALDAAAFSARYADARPDCVFQVHGDLFVDAARSAHFSRFLNHAARGTRPANLAAHATAPHGGFRGAALVVCFYATRDVAPGCAEVNRWFGRSRRNFSMLQLAHIEVDSADLWTNRSLSSSSRSPAEEAASTLSRTLTLKSS